MIDSVHSYAFGVGTKNSEGEIIEVYYPKPQINPSKIEIQRLMNIENEQKELVLLLERVSADLKDANNSKQILNQLLIGRSLLGEFANKFIDFKLFKKSGGFLAFFREKAKTYLSDGKL